MNVLIVDDDAQLSAAMAEYLDLKGAECDFAYNGEAGLGLAQSHDFDVIVLDLMMPKLNGYGMCEALRAQACSTPILMLTACDTDAEQLEGFQAGIDDYVVKPCAMPLLWARLQALTKRRLEVKNCLQVADLHMYTKEFRVTRGGKELHLTPTGWKILEYLMRKSPHIVSRIELEDEVWPDGNVDVRNVNVQLHQLRKAVDKPFENDLIHTVVGVGLVLRASDG